MVITRVLNAVAVVALVGSAAYAYSIKYETMLYSEKIQKTKNANQVLRDQISVLRAEWAHLTRPERIQQLAARHLDLRQLDLAQIVAVTDLPDRPPKVDSIGRKLEAMGLSEPTNTPSSTPNDPTPTRKDATPSAPKRQAQP